MPESEIATPRPEWFPEDSPETFTAFFCFDLVMDGKQVVKHIKYLVEEGARFGYRMVSVDNSEGLIDKHGSAIHNKRGSKCNITFSRI